jgi:hypothetical protein
MAGELAISYLNPLAFVPVTDPNPVQYRSKFYDDYQFADTIAFFQEKVDFMQLWQTTDTIKLQMTSNFAPILLDAQDDAGVSHYTVNMSQVRANKYQPGFYLYEATIPCSAIGKGHFRFILTPGGSAADRQKSEWFCIQDDQEPTILVEYFNKRYHADVVFETGILFSLRIPAFIEAMAPGSLDTLYTDQIYNQTQLSSRPYDNYTLWVGDGHGVPPWLIKKLNFALSCSNVTFDGKLLTKADSGKWSETTQEGYPMKGYSTALVPGINRSSRLIMPTVDTNKKVSIVYNIASNVFGSVDSQGGNVVTPITQLNAQ